MSNSNADDVASTDPTNETPGPPKGEPIHQGEADADAIDEAVKRASHPRVDEMTDPAHVEALDASSGQLPELKLPGFGEPDDDCGEFILPAMRFCTHSGRTHQFKHNCRRYDCPMHAPYAVRRRAAGSKDASGMAAQLKSLLLRLYNYWGENHYFHHLFVSLPTDEPWVFESEKPLERARELLREMMDELGIQGALIYHPYRGADEDRESDDRGFWQDILFHRRDWEDDVREELEFSPHFHIVGVAAHVDVSVTEAVEEATGWVIHRRTDEETGVSLEDDDAMTKALTYCLSHAGIYDTESGQRRLAAWMKGPDVASTQVYDKVKKSMAASVFDSSKTILGIDPPDLTCTDEKCGHLHHGENVDVDVDGSVSMASMTKPVSPRSGAPATSPFQIEGAAGWHTDGFELQGPPTQWKDFVRSSSSSSRSSTWKDAAASPTYGDGEPDDLEDVDEDVPECGGRLRHISKASEYLTDEDWRENATFAADLDGAYRDYVAYMTRADRALEDGEAEIPELRDPPPG